MKSADGSVCSYLSTTSGVIGVTRTASSAMPTLAVPRSTGATDDTKRMKVFFMAREPTCRRANGSSVRHNERCMLRIELDDLSRAPVLSLLEEHLRNMYELSPPEHVFVRLA